MQAPFLFKSRNLVEMKTRVFKILFVAIMLPVFTACNLFSSREKRTDKMVAREMERIDWNSLDHYPLFPECDELMTKPTQKQCFENTINTYLKERISTYDIQLKDTVPAEIFIDLLVDREGNIKIADIERNTALLEQIPEFNRLVQREINALPRVEPALKQGVPVNAKFRVPIILHPK